MGLPWLKTLPRDITFIYRFAKAMAKIAKQRKENETVSSLFDAMARKIPEKPCFYFDGNLWTYRKVQEESNQIGNYYSQQGLVKGDVVSLFMSSRVEVITTWLGLSKIGVVPALVNSGLVSDLLKFSIESVKPKAIICGHELSEVLHGVYPHGEARVPVFCSGSEGDRGILSRATDADKEIVSTSTKTPVPKAPLNYNDDLFYIYTSGTTGLPKAAVIRQSRYLTVAHGVAGIIGLRPSDVVYTCFPLQHTAAGVIAAGFALNNANPLVIRSKFSASEYWKDCIKYNVTTAQYIGEICRYLLKQPVTPEETQHNLRMMIGNGLRPELWHQFQKRFQIPLICEMYGSTEGNCNMFNIVGHPGAIGFIPPLLKNKLPITLIKLDDDDQPVRDPKTGLTVLVGIGEHGELVGEIEEGNPPREFRGYAGDEENSKKKILTSVRKIGDTYFRSGDICTRDEYGYHYFKDRIGDSFRFKSENVSATEVEGVINKITHIHDVIVYGVKVPYTDGSVGMAAIADPENLLNMDHLAYRIVKELPNYAWPRFLRIAREIEGTETHKLKKSDFKKEGFDLGKVGNDKLFVFIQKRYVPLTPEMIQKINSGEFAF